MYALCQSKFICGFASMLENQRPALPSIFVIPDLLQDPEEFRDMMDTSIFYNHISCTPN